MGKTIEVKQEGLNTNQAIASEKAGEIAVELHQTIKNEHEIVVKLHHPIKNKQTEITQLTLRRPVAADFFGVSMTDVLSSEPQAALKVVARISFPPLTELQCRNLSFKDTWELVNTLGIFFMK